MDEFSLYVLDITMNSVRAGATEIAITLREEGDWLYLQGDGSYVAKEECAVSDVVGKVHEIIRPSGKVIPVDAWQWRLSSQLWRGLGIFRNPCLRVLHKLFR